MTRRDTNFIEFIYCECGCGFTTSKYTIENGRLRNDRPKRFIDGHSTKGKHHSDETKLLLAKISANKRHTKETKKKMSEQRKGENNHNWKANDISSWGLHKWLRENIPKPKKCEMCKAQPPRDMANITGFYNRKFENWAWFCARCHKYFDNIIERNLTMKGKYMYRDSKTGRFMKKSQ